MAKQGINNRLVSLMAGRLASFLLRASTETCISDLEDAPVAQLAAQPTCNRQVSGFESPLGLTSLAKAGVTMLENNQ